MKIVCFLDLDDTLFQTRPKCPADEDIVAAAYHRDGSALSFMTRRQRTLLDLLLRSATVVPATARNLDAFRRIDLPFKQGAILDFGGAVILPDGKLDADWDSQIRPRALEISGELHAMHRAVEQFIAKWNLGAYARVIADFDMPLYVVIKHPQGDSAKLQPIHDELGRIADRSKFFLHYNDNNLSLVPAFLGKERAVKHLLEHRLGKDPMLTIGIGDSLTDGPFLELCDFSLIPRNCQLSRQGRGKPREA